MIKRMFVMMLLALILPASLGYAEEKEKEAVRTIDIKIIATASKDNAKAAKESAIADGLRQSFYQALLQLAPMQARDVYRRLRTEDLMRYVASYTINRESVKVKDYEAEIIFRFDKAQLENIIGIDTGLAEEESDPEGEGLLIIPAYNVGGRLLLFEQGNDWRIILNNIALEVGQGGLVMPFGDVRDQQSIAQESLIAADKETFKKMARRYGTRNVVIATAATRVQDGVMLVQVALQRIGAKPEEAIILQTKGNTATHTLEQLLAKMAQATAVKLRDSIADYSLFGVSEKNKVQVAVLRAEYQYGYQWRYMVGVLRNTPNLVKMEIGAVGVDYAQATLFYKGNVSVVNAYLQQQGLLIDDSTYKYWVVQVPPSVAR